MRKLYEWQKEAEKTGAKRPFLCLNADCGLGKTLAFILISFKKKKPTIIIAPKSICDQWKDDLITEGVNEDDIWVHDQPTQTKNKKRYLEEFVKWLQS